MYIVLEFMAGGQLFDVIQEERFFSEKVGKCEKENVQFSTKGRRVGITADITWDEFLASFLTATAGEHHRMPVKLCGMCYAVLNICMRRT